MSGQRQRQAGTVCRTVTSASPPFLDRIDACRLDPPLYPRALVVFGGRCGVWWLRCLKPGFRHCFAAVDDGAQWLTVDPLLHRLEIRGTGLGSGFDLAATYRDMGLTVIAVTPTAVPRRTAPIGPFTCVETMKRLLGFRATWVLTPWQLYRHLTRGGRNLGLASRLKEQIKKIILTSSTIQSKNKNIVRD